MYDVINIFTNREKAIAIWLIVFLVWVLSKKGVWTSVREPLTAILKQLFWGKFATALLFTGIYIATMVILLYKVKFWDITLLKDTVFWFLGGAFVLFLNANKASSEKHYFKKIILDNVKFVAAFEFIINLYVFNIFIELLIVPVIFLITAMIAITANKPEYALVKKLLNRTLAIFGFIFIIYAIGQVAINFKNFATLENLKDFLLTPVLTVTYLPFLYFLVLYMTYESLFVRIGFWIKDKTLSNNIKWNVFKKCHLRLNTLISFSNEFNKELMSIRNKSDVNRIFNHNA